MTVNLKIENQPIGSDQTPAHMVSKTVMKVFDNPKLVAAWMMLSMLEGHIDMCADYKMTTDEVENLLSAQALRECTKDMFNDYIDDLRASVNEVIADPEFCKTAIKSMTMARNDDGTYALDDAVVDLTFDFKGTRT
jgi:hypothetical protein